MLRVVRFQAAASVPVAATPEPRPGSLPEAASCLVFRQGNELGFWVYPPFDASVTWHGGMELRGHVSRTSSASASGPRLQEELAAGRAAGGARSSTASSSSTPGSSSRPTPVRSSS